MVQVRDILVIPSMNNSHLLSGEKNVDKTVSNISVMENPDFEDWAKPGTILLTSLYATQDFSYNQQFDFVKRLDRVGISALIIKTEKYVKKVPNGIVDGGTCLGLPIIQITKDTSYNMVTHEVMQLLFNEENKRLNYYHDMYETFLALSLDGRQTKSIIDSLQKIINHPIHIHDNYLEYNDDLSLPLEERLYEEHLNDYLIAYDSSVAYIISIELDGPEKIFLWISKHTRDLTTNDKIATHVAASFIKLSHIKNVAIRKEKQQTIHSLLHDTALSLQSRMSKLDNLALSPEKNFIVIIVENHHLHSKMASLIDDRLTLLWHKEGRLVKYKKQDNQLVIIIQKSKKDIQEIVYKQLTEMHIADYAVYIGMSETVNKELDFPVAYHQAKDALEIGKRFYAKQGKYVFSYADMGIYRTFSILKKESSLEKYMNPKLMKLLSLDDSSKDQLVTTLSVFLDEKQRYKNTATKLQIHWKTVKNRITKITKITGICLHQPEEALDIHVSLKLLAYTFEKPTI